ncbi:glycosyltransferase [Streptomyces sp. NP160]|uniref:glycosyltransferase n=1 Tax=Streptomyces sp. NP160 TaxID=2586637 RepID=UPI0015D63E53|nr:glycosyltransferase [Streptomyces sp. NP160]
MLRPWCRGAPPRGSAPPWDGAPRVPHALDRGETLRSTVVAKFLPWPPNSGDKRRTLGVCRALLERGPVTVVAFSGADEDAEGLRAQGFEVVTAPWRRHPVDLALGLLRSGSLSSARFYDRALERLALALPAADLLVVEHVQLLPLAKRLRGAVRVLDMHNVESVLAQRVAATTTGLKKVVWAVEARALRRVESGRHADVVAVTSAVDEQALARVARHDRVVVVPNAWDEPAPLPPSAEPVVSFVALMSWTPNVEAAVWFAREVWPLVLQRVPAARLQLVGRNPTPAVQALAGESVVVTGTVDSLEPWYAATRVAVAPLLAGGGSRLKILEALAAARPLVATTVGAEGLEDLVGRGVVVADAPADLAREVADLLEEPERAAALGAAGARAVGTDHSWRAAVAPLTAAVDALGRGAARE